MWSRDRRLRVLQVTAPAAGALVDRLGERALIVGGMLLQAAGTAWIALIAEPDVAFGALVAPMVLVGVGSAMAMPAAQKAVVGAVGPGAIGKAAGTFTTMRWFGGVFGIAIAVAIFAASGGYGSAQAFNDGFVPATAAAADFALAGALAGALVPGPRWAPAPGRALPARGAQATILLYGDTIRTRGPLTAETVRAGIRTACAAAGAPAPADIVVSSALSGGGHDCGAGPLPARTNFSLGHGVGLRTTWSRPAVS